jgi:hypothetical protein
MRGRYEEAIAQFRKLREDTGSTTALFLWPVARSLEKLGRWAEAEATYRQIRVAEERHEGGPTLASRLALVRVAEGQGRHDEAEAGLRGLVAENPRSGALLMRLAKFLRRTGRGEPGEIGRLFHGALMAGYRPTEEESDEVLKGEVPDGPGSEESD